MRCAHTNLVVRPAVSRLQYSIGACEGVRVDFSNPAVLVWHTEAYTDSTLVPHERRPTSRPLCLHITCPPPNSIVTSIYQERNTDVDNLGNQCIAFLVRGVLLNLRENEGVPILDDMLGQSSHCIASRHTQTSCDRVLRK